MADDVLSPPLRIITCAEAKALGLKRYFLGPSAPCKYGHISERLVSTRTCIVCSYAKKAAYHKDNREKVSAQRAIYSKANREKKQAYFAMWSSANADRQKRKRLVKYATNPEKFRARSKAWYAENIDLGRQIVAAWRKRNPEKMKAAKAAWVAANPERKKAAHAAWAAANPEKIRLFWQRRRARLAGAVGSHTAQDIEDIYSMQRGRCAICRDEVEQNYHVDHIQPLSKGGSDARSNLQITCAPCNLKKKDRDPIDHMRSLGFLL